MDIPRFARSIAAPAAVLIPAVLIGCDIGDTPLAGPRDLPGPAAEELRAPGPVPVHLVPVPDDVDGFAIDPLGDFLITTQYDEDIVQSTLSIHHWDDEMDRWSDPEPLHFAAVGAADGTPSISPDGSYLFFSSARPTTVPGAGFVNLWVAQREGDPEEGAEWSDPWLVPAMHSPAWDGTATLAGDGTLYFASERDGPEDGRSLYRAPYEDGTWMAPQRLPEPVNSSAEDSDPFVAPDGSYLVFSSNRTGRWELHVVHAEGDGWGEPRRLPDEINGSGDNRSPYLTGQGSTLFWIRDGTLMAAPAEAARLDRDDRTDEPAPEETTSPENGTP